MRYVICKFEASANKYYTASIPPWSEDLNMAFVFDNRDSAYKFGMKQAAKKMLGFNNWYIVREQDAVSSYHRKRLGENNLGVSTCT